MIRLAELKRRWRRISSSISFCARRRSSNFSALALFQRENLTSVDGRCFSGGGAKIGNRRIGHFSAIIIIIIFLFLFLILRIWHPLFLYYYKKSDFIFKKTKKTTSQGKRFYYYNNIFEQQAHLLLEPQTGWVFCFLSSHLISTPN